MTVWTPHLSLSVWPPARPWPRHRLWWLLPALTLAVLASGCASRSLRPGAGASEVGIASYYSDRHHGRKTASGELFDRHGMSAAHRTLPFGTRVRVQHLQNGREVTVRINDRGPFVKGRIIDLSHRAAEKLDMIDSGVARVRVTPLD
jgi:rare lipoprotein A